MDYSFVMPMREKILRQTRVNTASNITLTHHALYKNNAHVIIPVFKQFSIFIGSCKRVYLCGVYEYF